MKSESSKSLFLNHVCLVSIQWEDVATANDLWDDKHSTAHREWAEKLSTKTRGGWHVENQFHFLVDDRRAATARTSRANATQSPRRSLLWKLMNPWYCVFTFRIVRVQDEKCAPCISAGDDIETPHTRKIPAEHWLRCARMTAVAMHRRKRMQVWNYFGCDTTTYCCRGRERRVAALTTHQLRKIYCRDVFAVCPRRFRCRKWEILFPHFHEALMLGARLWRPNDNNRCRSWSTSAIALFLASSPRNSQRAQDEKICFTFFCFRCSLVKGKAPADGIRSHRKRYRFALKNNRLLFGLKTLAQRAHTHQLFPDIPSLSRLILFLFHFDLCVSSSVRFGRCKSLFAIIKNDKWTHH